MRSQLTRLTVLLAVPAVLVLGGCASADGAGSTASGAAGAAAPAALQTVTVTGAPGAKPTVKLATTPTILTRTGTRLLTPGAGAAVAEGQRVTVDYVLVNAKDGKEADTSFGKKPANFTADPTKLMPGLANSLIGQKVGSRLLAGVSPRDGFGAQGNPQLGFTKDDALIFVIDIKSAATVLKTATGTAVAPAAGLPAVTVANNTPTIAKSTAAAPAATVVQVLIKGAGPVVTTGQTIKAAYVGAIYSTGKVFDSSYTSGNLLEQVVGAGGLIPGFDKGLVGQTVGSRVELVVPPADGYGKAGQPQAGIKGTDTLVFVVDVLDAY